MSVRFRPAMLMAHRWIGIASAPVLCLTGVTGALLLLPGRSPIRRIAGPLHERLSLGHFGWWIVVIATIAAVFLEAGGLYLWWKRKRFSVRWGSGWKRAIYDVHHVVGLFALPLMLMLAATGVGMAFVTPDNQPELRRVIFDLHTTRGFSVFVKVVYALGSTGFLLQGASGIVMWWRPWRSG